MRGWYGVKYRLRWVKYCHFKLLFQPMQFISFRFYQLHNKLESILSTTLESILETGKKTVP